MTIEDGLVLLFCVAVGWAWPAVGMRMLEPTLRDHAPAAENHRGARVPVGLGLVWLVWALGSTTLGVLLDVVAPVLSRSGEGLAGIVTSALGRFGTVSSFVPEFLVVGVFVLGLVDDVYGDAGSKGLRGHLARLRDGVLTTGVLKLAGIVVFSASAAGLVAYDHVYGRADVASASGAVSDLRFFGTWIVATSVIAMTANLLNLLDLRPGRALKAYLLLAVPAATATAVTSYGVWRSAADTSLAEAGVIPLWALVVGLLLLGVGPVVAVWPADLGERGMLGDSGSNAMGALAGYLLVGALPLPWMIAAAAVLFGLTLLSERVSFSDVVERVAVLSWLDGLGRRI